MIRPFKRFKQCVANLPVSTPIKAVLTMGGIATSVFLTVALAVLVVIQHPYSIPIAGLSITILLVLFVIYGWVVTHYNRWVIYYSEGKIT